MQQSLDILGEATATIAATGIEELGADAGISTDALTDCIDIGADTLTEVGNVVHKRDAGSQHGIGSILGHLGRGNIHEDDTEIIDEERLIEARHHLLGLLAFGAHHDTVG